MIDMYVEHFDYDIMEMWKFKENEEQNGNMIESIDGNYSSDNCQEINHMDFHIESNDSISIKNISTQCQLLNKLCNFRILFRGNADCRMPDINETLKVDLDDNQIDHVYKMQRGCACKKGNKVRLMPLKDGTDVTIGDTGRELLIAMERDANNQMYSIAWVVLRVENAENLGWFMSLLHNDMSLNKGIGITIILDSHMGLCGFGLHVKGKELLDDMLVRRILLDLETFNVVMSLLCKQWMMESGAFFDFMVERRMVANAAMYNALINGYCLIGRVDEGIKLFDVMMCDRDVISYNILINGYYKNDEIDKAVGLMDEICRLKIDSNVVTYTTIIRCLMKF
nr:putative pentatricopeptide repeat-containing protein At1g12700, mitochondrial [Tanacetum cinerariifolium]